MAEIFISWTGEHARQIATEVKSLFTECDSSASVFMSDIDIQAGSRWLGNLLDRLEEAAEGFVIFGQEAIKSEWLLHEAAVLSSRSAGLTMFLLGCPLELVPAPLRTFQHVRATANSLANWVYEKTTGHGSTIPNARLQEFVQSVTPIIEDYEARHVSWRQDRWKESISRPMAVSRQSDSPFELTELIRIARQRLILIAQNHGYMTDPNGAQYEIERALFDRIRNGLTVDVVAMHPFAQIGDGVTGASAIEVWTHYMNARHFPSHLARCWETLHRWFDEYRASAGRTAGQLRVWGAYFTPVSINVIDPELPDGLLVLSPRMGHESRACRQFSPSLPGR